MFEMNILFVFDNISLKSERRCFYEITEILDHSRRAFIRSWKVAEGFDFYIFSQVNYNLMWVLWFG